MSDLAPTDCPKYPACSAPVCPLDPRWPQAVHLPGERVCFYLTCTGKEGAAEYFAGDQVFEACRVALPAIAARHRPIAKRVEQASRTGIKGSNLRGTDRGNPPETAEPPSGAA